MKTFHKARTECLMMLCYFYKHPYKELVDLKVEDVPALKSSLTFEEGRLLETYLLLRKAKMRLFPVDSGILFCTHGGQKMSPRTMQIQVSRLLEKADITKGKTGSR
jgi:hypothetical protein